MQVEQKNKKIKQKLNTGIPSQLLTPSEGIKGADIRKSLEG